MGIDFRRPRHIRGFRLGEVLIFGPGIGKILVEKTVTGAVASFSDAEAGYPLVNLEAEIVPQQASGTPSPTNPLPISGYTSGVMYQTEKNICKVTSDNIFEYNSQYSNYSISGNEVTASGQMLIGFICPVRPNTQYTASLIKSNYTAQLRIREYSALPTDWLDSSFIEQIVNTNNSSATFVTSATCNYVLFAMYTGTSGDTFSNLQLELGSAATTYEPYNGQTESRSFGQTIYGGTWKASQGKVEETYFGVDLGSLTWERVTSEESPYFCSSVSNYKYLSSNNNVRCSCYSYANVGATGSDSGFIILSSLQLRIRDNTYATASDFKTAMNGQMIVFELATPTEITVEPVNFTAREGTNNIFSNTGKTTVTYYADANP